MSDNDYKTQLFQRLIKQGKYWRCSALTDLILGIPVSVLGGFLWFGRMMPSTIAAPIFLAGAFLLFLAFLNYCFGQVYFDYAYEVYNRPHKIAEHFESAEGCFWNLIYNIFFGGIAGIKGALYGIETRKFVLLYSEEFKQIEADYIKRKALAKLKEKQKNPQR